MRWVKVATNLFRPAGVDQLGIDLRFDQEKATLIKVAFGWLDEVRGLEEDLLPVVFGAFVDGGDDLDGLACFGSAG